MNNLKELDVDIVKKVSQVEAGEQIHIQRVSTEAIRQIAQVDQGGINVVEYDYEGPYEATPTSSEQVFETENKTLQHDITVHATPYSEVLNPEGGYTATIL